MAGGDSSEREISLQSARQVAQALSAQRYNIYMIEVEGRSWSYLAEDGSRVQVDKNDFSLSLNGENVIFDYALIIIHGTPGEDGKLQGYLEMMGVPFSSGSMTSSVITFDKHTTKQALANTGIAMAKDMLLIKGREFDEQAIIDNLGLPLFVKPNASGSSFGVSKVKGVDELSVAIEAAFAESDTVLIEEAIVGREVSCGTLITSGGGEYLLPITEMISKREFFDYEAKYSDGLCEEITPAQLDEVVVKRLNSSCLQAYRACRCRGVVRIDFIINAEGNPYLIEINSIPGMSQNSIIPQQVRAMGMSVGEFFEMIIEDTL